ncbi:hypothetical protein [Enterococcus sp. S86.2]|uniref:hypothetical protein n=1 Tax=Enterococcus sp. S86.2 TaxID=3031299 RepID=UPI0026EE970C|nr:hypothetical protein [Enterococcus sp. S86.2]
MNKQIRSIILFIIVSLTWVLLMIGNTVPVIGRITVLSLFLLFLVFKLLLNPNLSIKKYNNLKIVAGVLLIYFFLIILFKYTGSLSVYNGILSIASVLFFVSLIDIEIDADLFSKIISTMSNIGEITIVIFFILSVLRYSVNWVSSSSLTICALYFVLSSKRSKRKKFFISLIWIFGAYFNGERTLVFISILTPIIYFLFVKIESKKLKKFIFVTLLGATILIPIVYVNLSVSQYRFQLDALSVKYTTSRFFSGRDVAWSYLLNNMSHTNSYIFGLGHGLTLMDISDLGISSHNLYLSVLSRTGFVGLILFYMFLYQIYSCYLKFTGDISEIGVVFLVVTVLKQSSEYGLLGNNMVLSLVVWFILAVPFMNNNKKIRR